MDETSRVDRFAEPRHRKHQLLWMVIAITAVVAGTMAVATAGTADAPVVVKAPHMLSPKAQASLPKTTVLPTTTTTAPTVFLPVVSNSPLGCTSGITDGVQWIKYVVKPGDTLWTIAACFGLNGYQEVYQQNSGVIGSDPSLIHPGQVFTITLDNRKMTETQ